MSRLLAVVLPTCTNCNKIMRVQAPSPQPCSSISQLRVSPAHFCTKARVCIRFTFLSDNRSRMNYKDHAIANRNTTERIKTAAGHSAPPPSRTKRTLSPSTRDSSPTCTVHDSDNNTTHSTPAKDPERESSSCTICLNSYEDRALLETCHRKAVNFSFSLNVAYVVKNNRTNIVFLFFL